MKNKILITFAIILALITHLTIALVALYYVAVLGLFTVWGTPTQKNFEQQSYFRTYAESDNVQKKRDNIHSTLNTTLNNLPMPQTTLWNLPQLESDSCSVGNIKGGTIAEGNIPFYCKYTTGKTFIYSDSNKTDYLKTLNNKLIAEGWAEKPSNLDSVINAANPEQKTLYEKTYTKGTVVFTVSYATLSNSENSYITTPLNNMRLGKTGMTNVYQNSHGDTLSYTHAKDVVQKYSGNYNVGIIVSAKYEQRDTFANVICTKDYNCTEKR